MVALYKYFTISILITLIISCSENNQKYNSKNKKQIINLKQNANNLLISTNYNKNRIKKYAHYNSRDTNLDIIDIFKKDNIEHLKKAINNGLDYVTLTEYRGKLGITPLHVASAHGSNQILKYSQKFNINVNIQDEGGRTLLHTAIVRNNVNTVELLLEMGADVNIKNKQGFTAMDVFLINKDSLDIKLKNLLKKSMAKQAIEFNNNL